MVSSCCINLTRGKCPSAPIAIIRRTLVCKAARRVLRTADCFVPTPALCGLRCSGLALAGTMPTEPCVQVFHAEKRGTNSQRRAHPRCPVSAGDSEESPERIAARQTSMTYYNRGFSFDAPAFVA